jgi:hypothetical protein
LVKRLSDSKENKFLPLTLSTIESRVSLNETVTFHICFPMIVIVSNVAFNSPFLKNVTVVYLSK